MKLEVNSEYETDTSYLKERRPLREARLATNIKSFAHFSNIDMVSIFHTSPLLVWIIVGWSSILQCSLLKFDISGNHHKFKIHFIVKKISTEYLNFSKQRQDMSITDDLAMIPILAFAVWKILSIFVIIYCRKKGYIKSTILDILGKIVGALILLDATIFLVIRYTIICRTLESSSAGIKTMAVASLIIEITNFMLHINFSRDLRYIKRNMFQGQIYRYFIVKSTGSFLLIIFSNFMDSSSPISVKMFFNLINTIFAGGLLVYQVSSLNFIDFGSLACAHGIFDIVYLWESILAFLTTVLQDVGTVDLDYFSFVGFSMMLALYLAFYNRVLLSYLFTKLKSIKKSKTARLYVATIYRSFIKSAKSEKHSFVLSSTMSQHVTNCRSPYCLCFLSKVYYDPMVQRKTSNTLQGVLDKNWHKIDQFNIKNSVSIFTELEVIKNLREAHSQMVSQDTSSEDSNKDALYDHGARSATGMTYIVALKSQLQVSRILCSFFVQLLQQVRSSTSHLYFAMVSFFLFEYKNYIATLISLYQVMYSRKVKRETNLLYQVMLENYISIAKQKLSQHCDTSQDPLSPKVELFKVMKYKKKSSLLQTYNRTLFIKKLDFYSELASFEVDYKQVVHLGHEVHQSLDDNHKLIAELMSTNKKDPSVINEAIFFELCILERPSLTKKTKKMYQDLHLGWRNERPNSRMCKNRLGIDFFYSSHAVIFADCLDDSFKISCASSNTASFFKVQKQHVTGMPITSLMPKTLAVYHDDFLFHFLNGTSKSKTHGKFESVAKLGDYSMKSVTILPKLEFIHFDRVYIGALVLSNKKNDQPIIFTNDQGAIIGTNKLASNLIAPGSHIEKSSLFVMLPKLFFTYNKSRHPKDPGANQSGGNSKNVAQTSKQKEQTICNVARETIDALLYPCTSETATPEHDKQAVFNESLDCFLFKMFASLNLDKCLTSNSANFRSLSHEVIGSPTAAAKYHWDQVRSEVASGGIVPLSLVYLSKVIFDNRSLILRTPCSILRVSVKIETKMYQRGLVLKQVIFESVHSTNQKAQKFFKILTQAVNLNSEMIDVLCVSPEDLNIICNMD